MATEINSENIYESRENIRNQISEYTKEYLELENVDLTKSSFLSFMIDTMSTMTGNLMFYQSSVYKEFFLTKAQLPESIYNLSSFLGYSPHEALYSTANILMHIPLEGLDDVTSIVIPEGFEFKSSDGVKFQTYYLTNIEIDKGAGTRSIVFTVNDETGHKKYNIPYDITDIDGDDNLSFVAPARQYTVKVQTQSIDNDIQALRFYTINVPVDGKIAELIVQVTEPGEETATYTQSDSLYLMGPTDESYVVKRSDDGRTIIFGNGIFGNQPRGGSVVIITIKETEGANGNVIASSITTSTNRIYVDQTEGLGGTPVSQVLSFSISNPSPAFGGSDEESLQETRVNAIDSLVSLNRLVAEQDYKNSGVVVESSPLANNSIPVLKRSDVKVNEIQLFTTFSFGDYPIVPTRNVKYNFHGNHLDVIPRGTTISDVGLDYITLFDMTTDLNNGVAYYSYIVSQIEEVPILQSTAVIKDAYDTYDLNSDKLTITKSVPTPELFLELEYQSGAGDVSLCECEFTIEQGDGTIYTMFNDISDPDNKKFTYTIPDYTELPLGELSFEFTIWNDNYTASKKIDLPPPDGTGLQINPRDGFISFYKSIFTIAQDLRSFMRSNMIEAQAPDTDWWIYDIPVILKSYYNGPDFSQTDFESQVLQQFLSAVEMNNYRMITDFVNVKLCNTIGFMENMLYNEANQDEVLDIALANIPQDPTPGDRYIISGFENRLGYAADWSGKKNQIAKCVIAAADPIPAEWFYTQPVTNDIAEVVTSIDPDKNGMYIYTQFGWIKPNYSIPLQIKMEVFVSRDYTVQEEDIVTAIKDDIMTAFQDRFGPNVTIHRSEIIDVVQEVPGVSHCNLLEPESSIFFNFDIDTFTQAELLEYTPEWVFFDKTDITILLY